MASKIPNVTAPAPKDVAPKPMIHLSDEHVPDGASVGEPVEMHVKGKVVNHSEHEDGKSMGIEIHSIKHKKAKKHPVGRAGGKDADMQEGMESAMDEALESPATEAAEKARGEE